MYEKFKSFLADEAVFTALLVILVGVVSFGLGRQSIIEKSSNSGVKQAAGVVFTQPEVPKIDNTHPQPVDSGLSLKVVGSRSGTKYHLLNCPGVKQMNEENKIFFDSASLAEAAGYTPATNCPGI